MSYYEGIRWSTEWLDCSNPLAIDTFSLCAFNCNYCFAKTIRFAAQYKNLAKVRFVNLFELEKLFNRKLQRLYRPTVISKYIENSFAIQLGGLSDPFDPFEKKARLTLEVLRLLDKYDYPVTISTKGVFFTKEPEYLRLIEKHPHNWHFKISIITDDDYISKRIERGCVSSSERIEAIKVLSQLVPVTLRFRPFIPGISDNFEPLLEKAKDAGAKSVTVEFLCLEQRGYSLNKSRYATISKFAGFDIYKFYKENSIYGGYLRLNPAFKIPILTKIRDYAHRLGLTFLSSDVHGRHLSDYYNCCGFVGNDWKYHFGYAVYLARQNKKVSFSDIIDEKAKEILRVQQIADAPGTNFGSTMSRCRYLGYNLYDYLNDAWNGRTTEAHSPIAYCCLRPIETDNEGNIVYSYVDV